MFSEYTEFKMIRQILLIIFITSCSGEFAKFELSDAGAPNLTAIREFDLSDCSLRRISINPTFFHQAVVADSKDQIHSFDLQSGKNLWTDDLQKLRRESSHSLDKVNVSALSFSADGESTFLGGTNFLAQVASRSGKVLQAFSQPEPSEAIYYSAVTTSIDQRFLAAIGTVGSPHAAFDVYALGELGTDFASAKRPYPQVMQIWSVESGKLLKEFRFDDAFVREIGFSPDQDVVFTASYEAVKFFRISDQVKIFEIGANDAAISGGSISAIFTSMAVTRDLRFIALKTLGSIYVVSTQSKKVIAVLPGPMSLSEGAREVIRSALHIEFTRSDSTLVGTDLDGLYFSVSIPDGEILESGHSEGFDRSGTIGANAQPLIAFDPDRRFVLETIPPPMRSFIYDPTIPPFPPIRERRCGIRMVRMPEATRQ